MIAINNIDQLANIENNTKRFDERGVETGEAVYVGKTPEYWDSESHYTTSYRDTSRLD